MDPAPRNALAIAAIASLVTTALWVALAFRTPTSTFHFAPIVAAAIGPYVASTRVGRTSIASALRISAISATVVAAGIGVLVAADRMRGPTFWSQDGAWAEAALFTALGALIGLTFLARTASTQPAGDGPSS